MSATIVWYRNDLRLSDHPALAHAASRGGPVIPLFIWSPEEEEPWAPGPAQRVWLRASLARLAESFEAKGSRLILRAGPALDILRQIIAASGADEVVWHTRYAPAMRPRDEAVRRALERDDIRVRQFASRVLHDPETIRTTTGGPYTVFTPFWKKVRPGLTVDSPLAVPAIGDRLAPPEWPESDTLDDLSLTAVQQDGVDWAAGIREAWTPGEAGARARLATFMEDALIDYPDGRNRPDREGTSMLSPHLHHGEISPRQVWTAINERAVSGAMREAANVYLSEIGWREFSYHVLHHQPHTTDQPLKTKFSGMPWLDSTERLERWQRGQTGYPIVDAGMRQLWETGWMHNRVRMIVASFLTKHLMIPWQRGAEWFWHSLVDADLANNSMGWQWSAGCGADAQPFFRIFNPITQGEKFDPRGEYVKRWVPELTDLPAKHLHSPWTAPAGILDKAGVSLGESYPHPIVDHSQARQAALSAYNEIK